MAWGRGLFSLFFPVFCDYKQLLISILNILNSVSPKISRSLDYCYFPLTTVNSAQGSVTKNINTELHAEWRGNPIRFCSGLFWPVFTFPMYQFSSSNCTESRLEIAQGAVATSSQLTRSIPFPNHNDFYKLMLAFLACCGLKLFSCFYYLGMFVGCLAWVFQVFLFLLFSFHPLSFLQRNTTKTQALSS